MSNESKRKKIIIFSEFGGGAHTSASETIVDSLSGVYATKVINIFSGAFLPLDPIRKITFVTLKLLFLAQRVKTLCP